jgi:hypothetical protein
LSFCRRFDAILSRLTNGARHAADHFACEGGSDIASELSLLAIIFLDETHTIRFVQVLSSDLSDLKHDPEKDFFGTSCARKSMRCRRADIAASDIRCTFC